MTIKADGFGCLSKKKKIPANQILESTSFNAFLFFPLFYLKCCSKQPADVNTNYFLIPRALIADCNWVKVGNQLYFERFGIK